MPLSMHNSNTGPRRGVVKSNSVQSQFADLTRERDNLRNAALGAARNRQMQENSIKALRQVQTTLMEDLRGAHTTLGTETKKRVLLQEEQSSKTKILEQDRAEIAKLNRDLVEMEAKEKNSKIAYSKEMTSLNDDLEDALRQQEEHALRKIISVPTIKYLLETLNAVESQIAMTKEERQALCVGIVQSREMLQEAVDMMDKEVHTKQELEEESRRLRYQAMQGEGTTEEGRKVSVGLVLMEVFLLMI